jgi:hypothetical protein
MCFTDKLIYLSTTPSWIKGRHSVAASSISWSVSSYPFSQHRIANIMKLTPAFVALMHITCTTLCQPILSEDNSQAFSKRASIIATAKVRIIKVLSCHFIHIVLVRTLLKYYQLVGSFPVFLVFRPGRCV